MKMKYIRLDLYGLPAFVIFSENLIHKDVAKCLTESIPGSRTVSAGFIEGYYMDAAHCSGSSISLNLPPMTDDTEMLRRQFGVMVSRN